MIILDILIYSHHKLLLWIRIYPDGSNAIDHVGAGECECHCPHDKGILL
jgi:hypothetical protein